MVLADEERDLGIGGLLMLHRKALDSFSFLYDDVPAHSGQPTSGPINPSMRLFFPFSP